MSDRMDRFEQQFQVARLFEWEHWTESIPYIEFKPGWGVKVVPPFMGAIVRFLVEKDGCNVSVYLDCYDMLGSMGHPYWEIYPSDDGDTERFDMNDVTGLIDGIERSLIAQSSGSCEPDEYEDYIKKAIDRNSVI